MIENFLLAVAISEAFGLLVLAARETRKEHANYFNETLGFCICRPCHSGFGIRWFNLLP